MYRERRACSFLEVLGLTVFAGMVCGGVYGWALLGSEGAVLGVFFGMVGGVPTAALSWPVMRGATMGAGCLSVPVAIGLSVGAGLVDVPPPPALLFVALSFVGLCAVGARISPADPPIALLRCEACGYDLRGVPSTTCPECGRERIVAPRPRR